MSAQEWSTSAEIQIYDSSFASLSNEYQIILLRPEKLELVNTAAYLPGVRFFYIPCYPDCSGIVVLNVVLAVIFTYKLLFFEKM